MSLAAEITIICLALAMGGILKGATGAGGVILAVPALVAFFDVQFAVVTMLIPNISTNGWLAWRHRRSLPTRRLYLPLLAGSLAGTVIGTVLLVTLSPNVLEVAVALAVLGYVVLRLARPGWRLPMARAIQLALPAGLSAGLLQGAAGLSSPVSMTFLNAIRLEREQFIAAISMLFLTSSLIQVVALAWEDVLTPRGALISLVALLPSALGMPVGAWIARHISPAVFDRIILTILTLIALHLGAEALFG